MSGLEVIGAISAIITILKTTSHVYERGKKAGEFIESLNIAGRRLPVLVYTLETYKANFESLKDTLPEDVCHALQETLNDCADKSQALSQVFSNVTSGPADTESRRHRYFKIVRGRGKETQVESLMTGITQDVQLLVNSEAIKPLNHSQNTDLNANLHDILTEIKELRVSDELDDGLIQSFYAGGIQNNHINSRNGQMNSGNGQQINNFKRVDNPTFNFGTLSEIDDFGFRKPLGICLDQAPLMPPNLFIGRASELAAIEAELHPKSNSSYIEQQQQRRCALGGPGGIGKTQIALAYAQTPHIFHETVLWFNATTEITLQQSFVTAAGLIFGPCVSRRLEGQEAVSRTREWLSDPQNSKWLLVFDNHDSPNDFTIDSYFPPAAHGAIIVTSRRASLIACMPEPLNTEPLKYTNEQLKVLETRSKRYNVGSDPFAVLLADRLGGLPLALATAGAYLQRGNLSFQHYLQKYNERWNIDPQRPVKLREYQQRTLFTTWDVSYNRLMEEDPEAAELLKLLAYFDNQKLWYELFHAGLGPGSPLHDVITDEICFEGVMATLSEFSFLEHNPSLKTWSMHNCIHDWILSPRSNEFDLNGYWYAFECIQRSIASNRAAPLEHSAHLQFVPHSKHLAHRRFLKKDLQLTYRRAELGLQVSELLYRQSLYTFAEALLEILLAQSYKTFKTNDFLTISIMTHLGRVHVQQEKFQEAKVILERIKDAGLLTYTSKLNLGHAYFGIGDSQAAEQMYIRALLRSKDSIPNFTDILISILPSLEAEVHENSENSPGVDFCVFFLLPVTESGRYRRVESSMKQLFEIVHSLCLVFYERGEVQETIVILSIVLRMWDRIEAPDQYGPLRAARALGTMHQHEGNFEEAERLFKRVIEARERLWASDNLLLITTLQSLGHLYLTHSHFEKAEKTLVSALAKAEQAFGEFHELTLELIGNLASLHERQRKEIEQKGMLEQRLAISETMRGANHLLTIDIVARLGNLNFSLHNLDVAEQMFLRALGFPASPQALGTDAIEQLDVLIKLSLLYTFTMRIRIHDGIQLLERVHALMVQRHDEDHALFPSVCSILEFLRATREGGSEGFNPTELKFVDNVQTIQRSA